MAMVGCAARPHAGMPEPLGTSVQIAPGASLELPLPPGYPQARTLHQLIRAQYGARRGVFEAVVSLAPRRVDVLLIAPGGPRLASLAWDEKAITRERAGMFASAAPPENILGDLFLCFWPRASVQSSLPAGLEVVDGANGARTITRGGEPIIEISTDPSDAQVLHLRNLAFGYQLRIETAS